MHHEIYNSNPHFFFVVLRCGTQLKWGLVTLFILCHEHFKIIALHSFSIILPINLQRSGKTALSGFIWHEMELTAAHGSTIVRYREGAVTLWIQHDPQSRALASGCLPFECDCFTAKGNRG